MLSRRWTLIALLILSAIVSPALMRPASGWAAPPGCSVSGEAYASEGRSGGAVIFQKVNRVVLPPGGTASTGGATIPGVGTTGTSTSSSLDTSTATQASATTTASVDDINLLAGQITADNVTAASTSVSDGVTASSSDAGTKFENLVIAGQPVPSDVGPNTEYAVPGVARVIVNEQTPSGNGTTTAGLTVNGLRIRLVDITNTPTGVEYVIASATSGATCAGPIPSPSASPSPGGSPQPSGSPSPGGSPQPSGSPLPGPGEAGSVVQPESVPFINQQVGTTSPPETVGLTNNGDTPLVIGDIAIVGEHPQDFAQTNDCGGVVQPGQNCTITVTFTPTAAGPRRATLQITDNAAGSPRGIPLSGVGAAVQDGYILTLQKDGTGDGTFTQTATGAGTPAGANATRYPAGTVVTLTPQRADGSTFTSWTVDGVFSGWARPLTITMNADHTAVGTFVPTPSFPDVDGATPFQNAILELAARGIIRGYEDGRFGPDETSLRAQMAALIARSVGWDLEDHDNSFPDRCLPSDPNNCIDSNLWRNVGTLDYYIVARGYTDAPTCASAGVSPPCYLPRDQVLRVQVISFITRAMVAKGYWQYQAPNPAIYPNVPIPSGHRTDLVTFVFYTGALPDRPTNANWDDWDTPAPRSWFAGVLWQALNSYFGEDDDPLADGNNAGGYVP